MDIAQQDIADALKVSRATVSRSLREDPAISEQTRARVRKVAEELGYRPRKAHSTYVGSVAHRTLMVLINVDGLSDDFTSPGWRVITGMSQKAQEHGLTLVTHPITDAQIKELGNPAHQPAAMKQGQVDGLICMRHFTQPVVDKLAERWPCIVVASSWPGMKVDCVDAEMVESMRLLVEHLHELGHRRIGYYGRPKARRNWRFAGYVQSMAHLNLSVNPADVLGVFDKTHPLAADARDPFIKAVERGTTAWVCDGERVADDAYKRLTDAGYRVPEDVSLALIGCSISETPLASQWTGLQLPYEKIGEEAVSRFIERLAYPKRSPVYTLIPCELKQGQTSGPSQQT